MIHLIRKFINTGNTALNVLIEEGNESIASELSTKAGSTGDTGGSATAGTIMGKLNKIISDLTTHMGRWTNTRAGYLDNLNSRLTSTRAGYLDYLANSTYGLSAIKTAINTLVDVDTKYYKGGTSTIATVGVTTTKCTSTRPSSGGSSDYATSIIKVNDNWIPEADGIVTVTFTLNATGTVRSDITDSTYVSPINAYWALGSIGHGYPGDSFPLDKSAFIASTKAKGTKLANNLDSSDLTSYLEYYVSGSQFTKREYLSLPGGDADILPRGSTQTLTKTYTLSIPVKKGMPVIMLVGIQTKGNSGYSTVSCWITNFKITGTLTSL